MLAVDGVEQGQTIDPLAIIQTHVLAVLDVEMGQSLTDIKLNPIILVGVTVGSSAWLVPSAISIMQQPHAQGKWIT